MNSTEYISIFESTMKKYIKRAKLRQVYLATLLDITPSALSQMIKCRMIMSRAQLHALCEGLKLSQDEALELQTLLLRIRDGESDYRTPFNRFMTASRRKHKLSIQRLAQLTKISALRLRSFEKDMNIDFTYEDAEKLSRIYECTPEFLMQKLSFGPRSAQYIPPAASADSVITVADEGKVYDTRQKIYAVNLKDFSEFSENANLFNFAQMRSHYEFLYDLGKEGVAITTDAGALDFDVPGDVMLFVTDKKPLSYVCRLVLCMDSSKKYHLLQKKENSEVFYKIAKADEAVEFNGKIKWSLAVIEMKFIPKLLV